MTEYFQRTFSFDDSRAADVLDELSLWSSHFGALLLSNIELRRGLTVLDLPCGGGFPLFELADMLGVSSRIVGVDLWMHALRRAASKQRFYGYSNVLVLQANGMKLPFANATFDLIVSNLGINNYEDATAVFRESARVMRPNGRIACTSNIRGHMREFYRVFRQVLIDLGKSHCLDKLEANEGHRGTKESIAGMLESAGFRVRRAFVKTFTMRYLDGESLFRHHLTFLGFLEGWSNVLDAGDDNEVFGEVELRLNEIARRGGELRLTIPMLYIEGTR